MLDSTTQYIYTCTSVRIWLNKWNLQDTEYYEKHHYIRKVIVELYGQLCTAQHTCNIPHTYKNHSLNCRHHIQKVCTVTHYVTEYHRSSDVCLPKLSSGQHYIYGAYKPDDANYGEYTTKLKTVVNDAVNHVRRRMDSKQQWEKEFSESKSHNSKSYDKPFQMQHFLWL